MTTTREYIAHARSRAACLAAAAILGVTGSPSLTQAQRALAQRPVGSGVALLDRMAGLHVVKVPLEEALKRLTERSGVDLAFSPTRIPRDLEVSCTCREVSVTKALDRLLAETALSYAELDGQVVIFLAPVQRIIPAVENVGALVYSPLREPDAFGAMKALTHVVGMAVRLDLQQGASVRGRQERTVAGVVVTARSLSPLSGATVLVPGTSTRAQTDIRGQFKLPLPPTVTGETVTLRVTMIGYRPQEQTVSVNDQNVRFSLAESAVELAEVVVTGTAGAVEKRSLGNAVARVRISEEAEVAPALLTDQLLNARAPGVLVMPPSGLAGNGSRVFIRGRSSIALPIDPLIYVDGIRVDKRQSFGGYPTTGASSGINDFVPEEIESIEIIKGPAAATLYGTEANNGVIQIITKRGKAGPTAIDVSVREGANWSRRAAMLATAANVWYIRSAWSGIHEHEPNLE